MVSQGLYVALQDVHEIGSSGNNSAHLFSFVLAPYATASVTHVTTSKQDVAEARQCRLGKHMLAIQHICWEMARAQNFHEFVGSRRG